MYFCSPNSIKDFNLTLSRTRIKKNRYILEDALEDKSQHISDDTTHLTQILENKVTLIFNNMTAELFTK